MDDATNIDDTATEETVEETTDGGMDTATETPDMGGDDTTAEETVEETTDGGMDTATETPDMGGDDTTTEE